MLQITRKRLIFWLGWAILAAFFTAFVGIIVVSARAFIDVILLGE